ncbi:hypothetical protein IWX50DRAFT_651168 [Phyllosticta citricarpa]
MVVSCRGQSLIIYLFLSFPHCSLISLLLLLAHSLITVRYIPPFSPFPLYFTSSWQIRSDTLGWIWVSFSQCG